MQALLTCETVAAAATQAKVPERTLYRWLQQDHTFQRQYAEARWRLVDSAVSSLQRGAHTAALTLRLLMADGFPPAVRLAAASRVLDTVFRVMELEKVVQRLERLETALEKPDGA